MDTNTVAHQRPTTTHEGTRALALRGLKLFEERGEEIEHEGHGVYTVPGCSGGSYRVDLAVFGGEETCSCPDHARHPEHTCKHLIAASIYRAKSRAAARGTKRPRFDAATAAANLERMGA
jgi:uncharacterized Zn finger protein